MSSEKKIYGLIVIGSGPAGEKPAVETHVEKPCISPSIIWLCPGKKHQDCMKWVLKGVQAVCKQISRA